MPLTVLNPIMRDVIALLPATFTDEDIVAVLLRDYPTEYAREVGAQAQGARDDGFARALEAIIERLESPGLSDVVKPTLPGEWKRLAPFGPGELPGRPDRSIIGRKFGRSRNAS